MGFGLGAGEEEKDLRGNGGKGIGKIREGRTQLINFMFHNLM